jgi:DNA gyrase subunit A
VTIIRTADDEKVVGLQRIEEIQTEELLDEEGNVIAPATDAEATDVESVGEELETDVQEDAQDDEQD